MADIDFSEACTKLVEIIQTGDEYPELYGLMLQVFFDSLHYDEETNRMALSLAKNAIKD